MKSLITGFLIFLTASIVSAQTVRQNNAKDLPATGKDTVIRRGGSSRQQSLKPGASADLKKSGTASVVNGYFRQYALDKINSGPAIIAIDEENGIWTALAKTGKLAHLSNEVVTLYDIGIESRPVGLAIGTRANKHQGAIWIAASYDNKLIRFDKVTKQTREYKIEGENSWPFNIALGPNGEIWFTQRASGRIGLLNPATGATTHYDIQTPNCGPAGLAVDPRTGEVWFTESYADRIGRLNPATGEIKEYSMGEKSTGLVSGPAGLAVDKDGGVWFAKLEGKIGYLAPGAETIKLLDVPADSKRPAGITVSPSGDVWLVALDGNLLLRYRPAAGEFTQYPLPTGEPDNQPGTPPFAKTSRPFGIAVDSQGNVWFSEQYTGQLGVLDMASPSVELFSPVESVRIVDPLLTLRISERVSGVSAVEVLLDGKPASVVKGHLDLYKILPGKHTLDIAVTDGAGYRTQITKEFEYAPGQIAVQGWMNRLTPKNKKGEAVKTELQTAAKEAAKGNYRENIAKISQKLEQNANLFETYNKRSFNALMDFQNLSAGKTVEVRILDDAPFYSQDKIVLYAGDSIVWKYDPPSNGHSISHKLHRIEIQGVGARSNLLRAGESFSYRFDKPGEYQIKNTENQSVATIKVVSR
jgi:streptogramin lyase/plastocyanin